MLPAIIMGFLDDMCDGLPQCTNASSFRLAVVKFLCSVWINFKNLNSEKSVQTLICGKLWMYKNPQHI